jgi:formylglycine-generating enzyme required for sulfatase activity
MNAENPTLDEENLRRVQRGGGWYERPRFARVLRRYPIFPFYRKDNLGFRLVRNK